VLITAVHVWGIHSNASSLATRGLVEEGSNIEVSAHRLVRSEQLAWNFALWADESVEKFLCIGLVNANARAMVPIFTTTLAVDHHAMIIRATADAVFSTVIAFVAGGGTIFRTRGLTSLPRTGWCVRSKESFKVRS
jgi:hypothetical protein